MIRNAIITLLAVCAFGAQPIFASGNGRLKGSIVDKSGAAIEKIVIAAQSPVGKYETVTDESGAFELELPAGVYTISTKRTLGWRPFKRSGVSIGSAQETVLNIQLGVALDDADCVLVIKGRSSKPQRRHSH